MKRKASLECPKPSQVLSATGSSSDIRRHPAGPKRTPGLTIGAPRTGLPAGEVTAEEGVLVMRLEPDVALGVHPEIGVMAGTADTRPFLAEVLRRHCFAYGDHLRL